jgi:hypothetical protein
VGERTIPSASAPVEQESSATFLEILTKLQKKREKKKKKEVIPVNGERRIRTKL